MALLNPNQIDGGMVHPNLLINGNFEHWSYGTSKDDPVAGEEFNTADRWRCRRRNFRSMRCGQSNGTTTPNFGQTMFVKRNIGDTFGTDENGLMQQIEANACRTVRGEYLTLSFWVGMNAAFRANTGIVLRAKVYSGSVANEPMNSITIGFTDETLLLNEVIDFTSEADTGEFRQFTTDIPVPDNCRSLVVQFHCEYYGTAANDEIYRVGEVKLERGTKYTGWDHLDFGVESNQCGYFFEKIDLNSSCVAVQYNSTNARCRVPFMYYKRTTPTITLNSFTFYWTSWASPTVGTVSASTKCAYISFSNTNISGREGYMCDGTVYVDAEIQPV